MIIQKVEMSVEGQVVQAMPELRSDYLWNNNVVNMISESQVRKLYLKHFFTFVHFVNMDRW